MLSAVETQLATYERVRYDRIHRWQVNGGQFLLRRNVVSLGIRSISENITIPIMNKNKEIDYGQQTISKINHKGSVILNGTTVKGKVLVTEGITATNVSFCSTVSVGGNATIISSTCPEEVNVDGNITATDTSAENLSAVRNISVTKCRKLGIIDAKEDVEAEDCPSIRSIFAKNHITLRGSTIQENVTSQKGVSIENSIIGGTLMCSSNCLVIEGSDINTIILRYPSEVENFSDGIRLNLLELTDNKNEGQRYQVLKLRKCTVKSIIFGGGHGSVILEDGSCVGGTIIGGKILPLV